MKPKHHYCFHNAEQLAPGVLVLDCWVHERKHQLLKQAQAPARLPIFVGA